MQGRYVIICKFFESVKLAAYFLTTSLFQIFLNQEHRLMLAFAPDYERLPLLGKVEAFEYALQNTEGNDLAKVYTRMLLQI